MESPTRLEACRLSSPKRSHCARSPGRAALPCKSKGRSSRSPRGFRRPGRGKLSRDPPDGSLSEAEIATGGGLFAKQSRRRGLQMRCGGSRVLVASRITPNFLLSSRYADQEGPGEGSEPDGPTVRYAKPGLRPPPGLDQNRIVSWLMSIPRSASRSSTLRSESGYRTYIITTRRITSGELLKYRNGLLIARTYHDTWHPRAIGLTLPTGGEMSR